MLEQVLSHCMGFYVLLSWSTSFLHIAIMSCFKNSIHSSHKRFSKTKLGSPGLEFCQTEISEMPLHVEPL